MPYIKQSGEVIVAESEKGVLQLWSMGYKNSVAIGGHQLSKCQIQKLTHLGVEITIAYDQGVEIDNIGKIDKNFYKSEFDKFLPQQKINCIYDKNGKILNLKESPMDNPNKWEELYAKKLKIR
jgi:DNA primase